MMTIHGTTRLPTVEAPAFDIVQIKSFEFSMPLISFFLLANVDVLL